MVDHFDGSRGENSAESPDSYVVSERVRELTWALLDEQINDDEFDLLENLLLSDANARDSYLRCIEMHSGLMTEFAAPSIETGGKSPVLGFLNADLPLGYQPSAEDAAS